MKPLTAILIPPVLFLAGCGGEEPRQAKAATNTAPVAVQTVTAGRAEIPSVFDAVGTVRARTAAAISSKVMGYVREVRVRAGDRVRQGQLLVVLDARDLDAAYRQAEAARSEARSAVPEVENGIAAAKANLDLAQVTFNRMKDLYEKRSISNQEFDEASMRLRVAKANHEMAQSKRQQLASKIAQAEAGYAAAGVARGYSEIAAPFDGTVTEKTVEPGSLAAPGTPLLTIEREGAYRLEVSVEESRIGAVHTGQPAAVTLDALGRTFDARVAEIVPAVDASSRAFLVKLDLPAHPQLRSGLFGKAGFTAGTHTSLTVPAGAIVERGQLASVLVADGGVAHMRLITRGETSGGRSEVLSGLSEGEKVVYPLPAGLIDGARVEVRP